ncbi:MAG: hypothetical protein IRZ21_06210 [Thermoleophilaceae bacterium]|nr:hypothetical protein [Thermoleophilaceae bacterium]
MGEPIGELAPGIWHWTARHPRIGIDVSSYWLPELRVLIDPVAPAEGIDWFEAEGGGAPETVLLTNRHHWRSCAKLRDRYGVTVRASRPGMHEFAPEQQVVPFDYGDELLPGVVAHEVGAICPDETAIHIAGVRALAVADGVVRGLAADDGLGFVPDQLMDDPERTKAGLLASYARLLELDFEHLLLAHGLPLIGNGREALRELVERRG